MKLWQVWDVLFPACPLASQAETRARRTYPKDPGRATVARYAYGWWVSFAGSTSPRFVHRGSGVVYYPTVSIPSREVTEWYFRGFHSTRRVWCLYFPHADSESEALQSTFINLGGRHFIPSRLQHTPWIRGSSAATEWLARELDAQGLTSERKRLWRWQARETKLFRVSHFQMPLRDALQDNGRTWHGLSPECLFEEADERC
jgi:hypothetical protein